MAAGDGRDIVNGGRMGVVKSLFGGAQEPAAPVATPAPPTATPDNTAAATAAAAQAGAGRAANVAAGATPADSTTGGSDDPYSVKKKLLGN